MFYFIQQRWTGLVNIESRFHVEILLVFNGIIYTFIHINRYLYFFLLIISWFMLKNINEGLQKLNPASPFLFSNSRYHINLFSQFSFFSVQLF